MGWYENGNYQEPYVIKLASDEFFGSNASIHVRCIPVFPLHLIPSFGPTTLIYSLGYGIQVGEFTIREGGTLESLEEFENTNCDAVGETIFPLGDANTTFHSMRFGFGLISRPRSKAF